MGNELQKAQEASPPANADATWWEKQELLRQMSDDYGLTVGKLWACMATVAPPEATPVDILSFLMIAHNYGLNPITREIMLAKDKFGRVIPIVPVDGWTKLREDHKDFDGLSIEEVEDPDNPRLPLCATATLWRKGIGHPFIVTERFAECRRDTFPWKQHPFRMLRHKAVIQVVRLAYGYGGIHDPDEAEVIISHGDPATGDQSGQAKAAAMAAEMTAGPNRATKPFDNPFDGEGAEEAEFSEAGADQGAEAEAQPDAKATADPAADKPAPAPVADGDPACDICREPYGRKRSYSIGTLNVCYKCRGAAREREGVGRGRRQPKPAPAPAAEPEAQPAQPKPSVPHYYVCDDCGGKKSAAYMRRMEADGTGFCIGCHTIGRTDPKHAATEAPPAPVAAEAEPHRRPLQPGDTRPAAPLTTTERRECRVCQQSKSLALFNQRRIGGEILTNAVCNDCMADSEVKFGALPEGSYTSADLDDATAGEQPPPPQAEAKPPVQPAASDKPLVACARCRTRKPTDQLHEGKDKKFYCSDCRTELVNLARSRQTGEGLTNGSSRQPTLAELRERERQQRGR